MRKFYSIFALCAFLFLSLAVQAEVLLNEHFNQTTETLATNENVLGYEIASIGWTNISGTGGIYLSSTDLTYSGYKSATDETGSAEFKTNKVRKVAAPLAKSINSGSVYVAAILNLEDYSTTSATASTRDYLWALVNGTSSVSTAGNHYCRLQMQKIANNEFQFGIAKQAESAAFISYTGSYAYGQFLLVMEYEFVAGDQNDVVRLYVNPTKGDKPATATIECKQSYINPNTGFDVGSGTKADAAQLKAILLNASTTLKLAAHLDELKVVTSWDDLWDDGETPESIDAPEPKASSISLTSATISWDAVENADSYVLQWKVNGGSYSDDIAINKDVRSYPMSGLESETKYYVRVKTIVGEDASEWATINFNTSSEPEMLVYKSISFEKYSTQDAMPTSGTVFLAKHVVEYNDVVTLTGNLTLNLHGKQLFMYGGHIVVPSGVTLAIYDDAGTGELTGGYAGSFTDRGIITVKEGGTLIIGEGAVINLDDENENEQVAIHNLGTLKLSGAPVISGNRTDIYLGSTVITIESGKPLTNATPYKVYKTTGSSFTSGWANMSGESPKDYFSSTNVGNGGVCLNASGEAQIVPALNLSESSNNTSIASNENQLVNVNLTRSLTSSQYNTFCLPFALDDDQLQELFGTGYDLEEFESSSLEGDVLSLVFNKVTSLEAGKPYLLRPSVDVANPSFEGVTIAVKAPVDQTSDTYISFHGTFAPTELQGGNKNLLFLGAGNELFWPEANGNLKAFRAYFEVKGGAAKVAKRARIVQKGEQTQAIDLVENPNTAHKRIIDGQLVIEKNGTFYNAQGQIVK